MNLTAQSNWLIPTRIPMPWENYGTVKPKVRGAPSTHCKNCGKELTAFQKEKQGQYCGYTCSTKHLAALREARPSESTCLTCGRPNPPTKGKQRKFCCNYCNHKYQKMKKGQLNESA